MRDPTAVEVGGVTVHEGIGAGGRRGVHADVVAAGVGGAGAL
jgi:hypothetical protein